MIAKDKDVGSKTRMSGEEILELIITQYQTALLVKIVATWILIVDPQSVMEKNATGGAMVNALTAALLISLHLMKNNTKLVTHVIKEVNGFNQITAKN